MKSISPKLIERNRICVATADPLYDRINKVWATVEEFIRKNGVLSPVALEYRAEPWGDYYIGIQKFSGKWHVAEALFAPGAPDDAIEWSMIKDASLETRIALLEQIPALFEALVENNEETVLSLEKRATAAEELIRNLGIGS